MTGGDKMNKGIDVSSFQGIIDWKQVKEDGISIWSPCSSMGNSIMDSNMIEG